MSVSDHYSVDFHGKGRLMGGGDGLGGGGEVVRSYQGVGGGQGLGIMS